MVRPQKIQEMRKIPVNVTGKGGSYQGPRDQEDKENNSSKGGQITHTKGLQYIIINLRRYSLRYPLKNLSGGQDSGRP